jgi:hypothetical protein
MIEQDHIAKAMQSALDTVSNIYNETSMLLETLENLMGEPHKFHCSSGARAMWYNSTAYSAGNQWMPRTVSRYWEDSKNPLSAILINIDFFPAELELLPSDRGPVVTAMALDLRERVESNQWRLCWREKIARDRDVFDVDESKAPVYRSTLRPDAKTEDVGGWLNRIDNIWIPLVCLSNRTAVRTLLVEPLKALALSGDVPSLDADNPYICLATGE